jgi:hypothetical protein
MISYVAESLKANINTCSGSAYQANVDSKNAFQLNKWYHMAITVSGTTSSFYVNGVLWVTTPVYAPRNVQRTNNYFGYSSWGLCTNLLFSEIRFYNRSLLVAEVQSDYSFNQTVSISVKYIFKTFYNLFIF